MEDAIENGGADPWETYVRRLRQKRRASVNEAKQYQKRDDGVVELRLGERIFLLEPEEETEGLDWGERGVALRDPLCWDSVANAPQAAADLPPVVDHRGEQSPVRDQGDRGTCVAFAALANLETLLRRRRMVSLVEGMDVEFAPLSPQYAHWLFMHLERPRRKQCDDGGLRTTRAADHLCRWGVCADEDWPYEDSATVNEHCDRRPYAPARRAALYGIRDYALVTRPGAYGPSIANTTYLESLLYAHHDLVFGAEVAWGFPDANGVYDVVLDHYGNPFQSGGSHAMLLVGYNREDLKNPYFIVKNSWGLEAGEAGYFYLSYDYFSTYARYGYIALSVRDDMPLLDIEPTGKE